MHLVMKLILTVIIYGILQYPNGVSCNKDLRSPSMVNNIHYTLRLSIPNKTLTTDSNEFSGYVEIAFKVKGKTNIISLHTHKDYIKIKSVTFNGTIVGENDYNMDDALHNLHIKWKAQLCPNVTYKLLIQYDATMSTTDMLGMYKINYVDEKGTAQLAVFTNFDRSSTRRVFPCFDEPHYKAIFDVSVTVPCVKYAKEIHVQFNTQDQETSTCNVNQTVIFARTPKLPTYLLSLSLSKINPVTNRRLFGRIIYNTYLREELADGRNLMENSTIQLWSYFSNVTSNNLHARRLYKVDQIAIPDSRAISEGKWGMLTFSENDIYWNKNESSNIDKQKTIITIAKKVAQQWFRNLDSMNGRTDLVMNAGFATYFSYYAANEIHPEFRLNKQFVVEQIQTALYVDSFANTQALQTPCGNPANIPLEFERLCQSKGASLLNMIENVMSKQNFKAGIQKYVNKNISHAEDIWNSLYETNDDKISLMPEHLSKLMTNWIHQSGYPVLTARRRGRKVIVSQETFPNSDKSVPTRWYVPIRITYKNIEKGTSPLIWLKPVDGSLDLISLPNGDDWIVLNNEATGYYRVNYGDSLWDNIVSALHEENFGGISEINRAKLVDDSFHLARVGKITFSRLFDNISFLRKDISYYPWYAAFQGFEFMLNRFGEYSILGSYIKSDLLELMNLLNGTVTVVENKNDDYISLLRQNIVLAWAGRLNITHYVQDLGKLFYQSRNTNKRPNKNLRFVIYCNALRYNKGLDNWVPLMRNYGQNNALPNEQVTIISALGCSNNSEILESYLSMTVQDSWIKQQHRALAFKSVYSNSPQGLSLCLKFLTENFTDILQKYQYIDDIQSVMEGLAYKFTTDDELDKFKTLLDDPQFPESMRKSMRATITTTEENLKWSRKYGRKLEFYYKIRRLERAVKTYAIFIFAGFCAFILLTTAYFIYRKRFANHISDNTGEIEHFPIHDSL